MTVGGSRIVGLAADEEDKLCSQPLPRCMCPAQDLVQLVLARCLECEVTKRRPGDEMRITTTPTRTGRCKILYEEMNVLS